MSNLRVQSKRKNLIHFQNSWEYFQKVRVRKNLILELKGFTVHTFRKDFGPHVKIIRSNDTFKFLDNGSEFELWLKKNNLKRQFITAIEKYKLLLA